MQRITKCKSTFRCQEETTVDRCWYTCPESWDLFQNSCYFFGPRDNRPKKFTQALEACQDIDGYLVEIESKAEDDFIIEKATSLASHEKDGLDYWIGAQDSDNDGNWTWATSGLYIPIKRSQLISQSKFLSQ